MNGDSGIKSCLSIVGGILGILVALITIIKFFYPDATSFSAFIASSWPGVESQIKATVEAVHTFASSSPFTPWWTAVLVIIIGTIVAYITDIVAFFEWGVLPVWAAPALLWVFVFYGIAHIFGIIIFLVVYFLAPKVVELVASLF